MPRLPIPQQALRLAPTLSNAAKQSSHICRACIRQYHPSPVFRAELPFWKRMQQTLFGTPEKKVETEKRDEAHQKHLQEIAEQGAAETIPYTDDQGREWQIAAVVDPSINKQYVQAQRWDGLEWVGSKQWVALQGDMGEAYVGFNPRRKLDLTAAEWRRVVHHVAVETLALAQAERDVNAVWMERDFDVEDWMRSASVQIKEIDGAIELHFPTVESRDAILNAVPLTLAEEISKSIEEARLAEEKAAAKEAADVTSKGAAEATAKDAAVDTGASKKDAEASAEIAEEAMKEGEAVEEIEALEESEQEVGQQKQLDAKEIDAQEKSTMRSIKEAVVKSLNNVDSQWLHTPLLDPAMKLAMLKRITQLTGHRLPDPAISSATSLSDLYLAYKRKPEPKRLADARQMKEVNVDLPNVKVHQYRQTPIDKEKQVGRWKVIEEELLARNLPVTGSRYQNAKTTSPML